MDNDFNPPGGVSTGTVFVGNHEERDSGDVPIPDPLKLIIVTCKTKLNCHINLELLAKKLPLDDIIVGKKLLGVVEEGLIKTHSKSTKVRRTLRGQKKTLRKDFSNQCTIVVKLKEPERLLNLKIFGNGIIVITGGLSKNDGLEGVRLLKRRLINLVSDYQLQSSIQITELFPSVSSYLKFIGKNYLVFLKFFSMFNLNLDLRLDLILNKRYVERSSNNDSEPSDPSVSGLIKSETQQDLDGFLRLIQIFRICHHYFPNTIFLGNLDQPNHPIHVIIQQLYRLEKIQLPVTFDREELQRDDEVTVENYNTMFNCGFHNNRETFTQILNDKYKKMGIITSAKFEPSNYQGINVKYISRILCNPDCQSPGKKKTSKCPCKEISFLIFQEGNIIITGGRSWQQLEDGYQVITKILKDEYPQIVVTKNVKGIGPITLPSQITDHLSDGTTVVYLNKKKQIAENPRNVFLLKRLGLLDDYL